MQNLVEKDLLVKTYHNGDADILVKIVDINIPMVSNEYILVFVILGQAIVVEELLYLVIGEVSG